MIISALTTLASGFVLSFLFFFLSRYLYIYKVMAKSKSFFGLRTGSTKSLTFQVYRGQQITKDRVYRVSNPRTEAQMKQRAIIPIVAASRAALKGLVDHSFEGVNYGNDSLKKFSELNLRSGALIVDSYAPNGYSNPGFANLMVSTGSLSNGGVTVSVINNNRIEYLFPVQVEDDHIFKAAKAGDSADDVLKTLAEWGATNCEVVAPGNQLTFLTVPLLNYVKVGDNRAPISAFDINRILFPSTGSTPAQVDDVNGSWKLKEDVSEGSSWFLLTNGNATLNIYLSSRTNHLGMWIEFANRPIVCGGALIRSAYVNGTWKRSNAKIVVHMGKDVDKYTYEMWRSYYESTGVSAKFLNQGNESTGIND